MSEQIAAEVSRPGPVFVCKFRGGGANGAFRLATGSVPARAEVGGERYEHAGEEPQSQTVYTFDNAQKRHVRENKIVCYYQIYRPARAV